MKTKKKILILKSIFKKPMKHKNNKNNNNNSNNNKKINRGKDSKTI